MAFGYDGPCRVRPDVHAADIQPLEVPALAEDVESVIVSEPFARYEVFIVVPVHIRPCLEIRCLVLECIYLDLSGRHVLCREYVEIFLRPRLPWHLVLVGLQSRPWLAQGIDDPELLYRAHVVFHGGEMPRIRRPYEIVREYPCRGVLFRPAHVAVSSPSEFCCTVGSDPVLDNRTVLGVLCRLRQIFRVHPVQVGILCEYSCLPVRRYICPGRVHVLLFVSGNVCQPAGCYVIFK